MGDFFLNLPVLFNWFYCRRIFGGHQQYRKNPSISWTITTFNDYFHDFISWVLQPCSRSYFRTIWGVYVQLSFFWAGSFFSSKLTLFERKQTGGPKDDDVVVVISDFGTLGSAGGSGFHVWYTTTQPLETFWTWGNVLALTCSGYIGDYTTQSCGDYHKPL